MGKQDPKQNNKKDPKLTKVGVSSYNVPKRTPSHPKKSHVVVAKQNGKTKIVRFGDQKLGHAMKRKDAISKERRRRFKARFDKLIQKYKNDKFSPMYWSNRKLW